MILRVQTTSYVQAFFAKVYGESPYNLDLNQRHLLRAAFKAVPAYGSTVLTVHCHGEIIFESNSKDIIEVYRKNKHMFDRGVFGLAQFFEALYNFTNAYIESGKTVREGIEAFLEKYSISEDMYSLDNALRQFNRIKKAYAIFKKKLGSYKTEINPGLFFSPAIDHNGKSFRQQWRNRQVKEFGLLIKDMRLAKGLSQKDLALQGGLSPESISKWETGTRDPRLSTLAVIAFALNCKLEINLIPNDI